MSKSKDLIKQMMLAAIGAALYVVVSLLVNIPIINRISLDLGYVVLGVCISFMNPWQLMFVGGVGCILKALLTGGNFPIAWFPSQLLLMLLLSRVKNFDKLYFKIIYVLIAVFACICLVKTFIEVPIYHLPFWAKMASNSVAALVDGLCLCLGLLIPVDRLKK